MATILKFMAGRPEVIALAFDGGKNCEGKFGPQVQFTTVDDRIFWLDPEPAGDVERELVRLGIRAGMPFKLTRVKTSHGGHRWDVEALRGDAGGHHVPERARAAAAAPPSALEAQLEKSVELARTHGPKAFIGNGNGRNGNANAAPAPEAPAAPMLPDNRTLTQVIAGALVASIDAYKIAADYAASKGIKVSLELDFNAEDVRCSATSSLIEYWRSGGTRA